MKGLSTRARAAALIDDVVSGRGSLSDRLPAAREGLSARDGALLQALVYGTLRYLPRLQFWQGRLLDRPVKARDSIVGAAILLGLYQLAYSRVPTHAAVSESVEAVRAHRRPRAAGLVNAVLRRFDRERDSHLAAADAHPPARWLHPEWLMRRFREDWPDHWQAIVEAGNAEPPLCLRVNRRRLDRDALLGRFEAAGIEARPGDHAPDSVYLPQAQAVDTLPGFADGDFSVQDESAQLVVSLMGLSRGQRVLDACAAPGGKAAHMLEACEGIELLALDQDAGRLQRVHENLARLGLEAECRAGDAAAPADWWDRRPFDRILLDVPCSGTGVIRRHPDIKALRRAADIPALAARQAAILASAWSMLAPGGRLVYCTCSVLRAENEAVLAAFLQRHPEARARRPELPEGLPAGAGLQRLSRHQGGDGFFYALIHRAEA
ncbi:16S rRNA (cytosine(967)-C(5))-methyltransferase RsmB [Natronospira bacteriovora]|uniref:16S rRNA (cytosine(967)-C(5))-methyltransferase n=1 Tax=Natronospira bacteriovora TaxID=3069753 RepID=A0ABU0WAD7_9GAMM|nr:16S rRNA (cytosine(967)-C(5))-methyltransferase RsmB [Natronospira sp. AB-CW4]MDQ2070898.1 16S rRNA (cytosine(967)-C(5))-methyltransferase RsmB [Natronospira sp. AB-CW4]